MPGGTSETAPRGFNRMTWIREAVSQMDIRYSEAASFGGIGRALK